MTKEEAIELFKDVEVLVFRDVKQKYFHEDIEEAFKLAIGALEQQPCEDAISRAEALKAIEKEKQGWEGAERYAIDECHSRIAELPSVTPQPRAGHWIEKAEDYYKAINEYGGGVDENTDYFTDDIACSKCLSKFSTIDNETERFRHCPNCGARMKESEEKECR